MKKPTLLPRLKGAVFCGAVAALAQAPFTLYFCWKLYRGAPEAARQMWFYLRFFGEFPWMFLLGSVARPFYMKVFETYGLFWSLSIYTSLTALNWFFNGFAAGFIFGWGKIARAGGPWWRKRGGFSILAALILWCAGSAANAGEDLDTFRHGGRARTYHLHAPKKAGPGTGYPLVIVLHGALDNAFAVESQTGFTERAVAEKFIVVYPNGTGADQDESSRLTWNGGNCCGYAWAEKVDDVDFIRALVDELKARYPIDTRRIYATGFSNGGLLAYRLACRLSEVFAAVAPVSGSLTVPVCTPKEPVSVLAFNGTSDQKVLYNGGYSAVIEGSQYDPPVSESIGFWAGANRCAPLPETELQSGVERQRYADCAGGSAVELYKIQGGGHVWPVKSGGFNATDIIWEFFKTHPKLRARKRRV